MFPNLVLFSSFLVFRLCFLALRRIRTGTYLNYFTFVVFLGLPLAPLSFLYISLPTAYSHAYTNGEVRPLGFQE